MITDDELKWCIDRYADMILRIAVSYCGGRDEAEDMVQEVFLRLVQNSKGFVDEENRKRWLIRVTVNLCRNELRSGYKRRVTLTDDDEAVFGGCAFAENEHSEEHERLRAAVARLPEKLRAVVHLFYYEDYPVKNIASILSVTEAAVLTRLHRARARLKEQLKGDWEDEPIGS